MAVTFPVQLVQSAMVQQGIWPRTRPPSCVYDDYTRSRMPTAISRVEDKIRDRFGGSFVLSLNDVEEGQLKNKVRVTPSADGRAIVVSPTPAWGISQSRFDSVAGKVKSGMGQTRLIDCAPAASPGRTPDSVPEVGAVIHESTSVDPVALKLYVPRLASGLYALGHEDVGSDFDSARWNDTIASAFIVEAARTLGRVPAVTGRNGDAYIYVYMPGATTKSAALNAFMPLQTAITAARARAGIVAPAEPGSGGGGGSGGVPAAAEEGLVEDENGDVHEVLADIEDRGGTVGPVMLGLGIAATIGVGWMFWKLVK